MVCVVNGDRGSEMRSFLAPLHSLWTRQATKAGQMVLADIMSLVIRTLPSWGPGPTGDHLQLKHPCLGLLDLYSSWDADLVRKYNSQGKAS